MELTKFCKLYQHTLNPLLHKLRHNLYVYNLMDVRGVRKAYNKYYQIAVTLQYEYGEGNSEKRKVLTVAFSTFMTDLIIACGVSNK